ncbi:unnamed protein product [Ectocarpus sp. 12 AP-2014]
MFRWRFDPSLREMAATRTAAAAAALTLCLVVAVCLLLSQGGRYPTILVEFPGDNNALRVYGDPRRRVERRSDDRHIARGGAVDGGTARGPPSVPSQQRRSRALQGLSWQQDTGALVAAPPAEGGVFPALEESTVMFLHVFKCAGSTLRRMLVAWAEAEDELGAIVHQCNYTSEAREICLAHYQLIDEPVQLELLSRQKVLAGHFLWGFQRHLKRPYLMVTALRNPLEVYVSAQQYTHKRKTRTLEKAQAFVSKAMRKALLQYGGGPALGEEEMPSGGNSPQQIGGFVFRLVGGNKKKLYGEKLEVAVTEAMANLETFWLVGVVEQYAGFEEVLKLLLDPERKHDDVWQTYSTHQFNTSPVRSREVLATLDPQLVREFNGSLALQWRVYEKAVALWDVRCRGALPVAMHEELCTVDLPSSEYR